MMIVLRRVGVLSLLMVSLSIAVSASQVADTSELTAFQARLDRYVEMHRRLEGPLPPLMVTADMDEVHRLMEALRARIRGERKNQGRGWLFTPAMVSIVRSRISSRLTIDAIADTTADVEEHTPLDMPAIVANEPLPEDAPFGFVPPQLLRALPPLPAELRYLVLAKALVIWDHHADLVVDLAPGVFDPLTYSKKKTLKSELRTTS
jgi:hypothetical protein